jgi:hypothetical protein
VTELEQLKQEINEALVNYVAASQRAKEICKTMEGMFVSSTALQRSFDEEKSMRQLWHEKMNRYLMLKQRQLSSPKHPE